MHGLDTYDHAMCVHFHFALDMKLLICLQLISIMIPIGTINYVTRLPLCKYYSPIFCD